MWSYINDRTKKVVVFDLNGTLTNRVSDHPKHLEYRNAYIRKHSGIRNTTLLPAETSSALKTVGLSPLRYYIERNNEFDWNDFHTYNSLTFDLVHSLKERGFKIVLYTDCHGVQVKKTLEILNLLDAMDLIITEERNMKKPSPKAFQFIAESFQCSPMEIVMIGNEYVKDLLPLILMGGSGIKVESEQELAQAISKIMPVNKRKAS